MTEQKTKPWYKQWWGILFFIFFSGLAIPIFVWKNTNWSLKNKKIFITCWIIFLIVVSVISIASDTPADSNTDTVVTEQNLEENREIELDVESQNNQKESSNFDRGSETMPSELREEYKQIFYELKTKKEEYVSFYEQNGVLSTGQGDTFEDSMGQAFQYGDMINEMKEIRETLPEFTPGNASSEEVDLAFAMGEYSAALVTMTPNEDRIDDIDRVNEIEQRIEDLFLKEVQVTEMPSEILEETVEAAPEEVSPQKDEKEIYKEVVKAEDDCGEKTGSTDNKNCRDAVLEKYSVNQEEWKDMKIRAIKENWPMD